MVMHTLFEVELGHAFDMLSDKLVLVCSTQTTHLFPFLADKIVLKVGFVSEVLLHFLARKVLNFEVGERSCKVHYAACH